MADFGDELCMSIDEVPCEGQNEGHSPAGGTLAGASFR
jgi:hypothetical protein